jgi:beta-glucosidase
MRTRCFAVVLISYAVLTAVSATLHAQTSAPTGPVVTAQETKGTPDQRADQILQQLSLQEKVSLLSGKGNGFITYAIPRLGITGFDMSDGPQGVRNGPGNINQACAFPCGAALAATWDPDLAAAYGKAVGLEARARGTHFQLGPGLNITRVPVNGRNFEYFGEDPYLAGVMGARWAKGCSDQGVVPTIKHYAANNQEVNRNSVDTIVDERTMQEIYLPAFHRAVVEGGNVAVMCSYNRLNGSYASNNDWLQKDVLKKQWHFPGLVMSDWGASHDVTDVAKGLDLEMPSGQNLNWNKIQAAMAAGTVKEADINDAVHRILRTAFAMGWFDANWKQKNEALPLDSADSAKVALDVARASIVLLKNDRAYLPLDRAKIKNVVVIGPNATIGAEAAFATPGRGSRGFGGMGGMGGGPGRGAATASGPATARGGRGMGGMGGRGAAANPTPANIGGGGSGAVTPFPAHIADADYFQGIKKAAGEGVNVTYLPVAPAANPGESPTMPDAALLKAADAVIVCVGFNRNSETEGRDRPFDLPQLQQDLIKFAATNNSRTIVINNSGAAVGMTPWLEQTPAVVQAWYLGQEGGIAIGEVLFGDFNPSGHLVSTFDRTFEDNPAFKNYPGGPTEGKNYTTVKYEEGLFYGYRGYDKANKAPLFPFGFGLSYTTFQYSGIRVDVVPIAGGIPTAKVSLDVKNTGTRAGTDIVQIYVGEQGCPLPRPTRELKAFAKVQLKPGQSTRVEIPLAPDAFAYWSPDKKSWTTDFGNAFTIEAASSERDVQVKQVITLK